MRRNPTAYHGGNFEMSSLEPVWMAHDNANQEYGVGIYFTTNQETAKRYGPKVTEAFLNLERFVPARDFVSDHFTQEEIAELIYETCRKSSKDDVYYFVTNYFEYPYGASLDRASASLLASNFLNFSQIRHMQNELAEIDTEAFVEAWNEIFDIDGTYTEIVEDEFWFAVINPEIKVTDVEIS